jgi:sulfate permease, SulP family
VAVVALPLAMALAIASGTTPERGLFTAVIAGFLISALGGSRLQIGGPTGAFVVVVFATIERHGYDGLLLATLMAGAMLILLGLARLGTIIKYIPYPVVTGFTSGIAVIIFTSQIKDFLGLELASVPADFVAKVAAIGAASPTLDPATCGIGVGTLILVLLLRRLRPQLPAFLIAVAVASLAVWATGLEVETIGSRFGGIPRTLPAPSLPEISFARLQAVLPDAFTIALLAAIESLLSAVIADGLAGTRHRSNCELVAQGVANIASPLFGGLPATGAIARTATNIRSGARTPIAGMLHAAFLLLFMLLLAPLANGFPLASLAAVLIVVAWTMSEAEHFTHLLRAPRGDRLVLLLTFGLTVLVDITVAVNVGVVLAALLFMQRMSAITEVQSHRHLIQEDTADLPRTADRQLTLGPDVPEGVAIYRINGPFFFGASWRLADALDRIGYTPHTFILDLAAVPFVDATGAHALYQFIHNARRKGATVILAAVRPETRKALRRGGLVPGDRSVRFAPTLSRALALVQGRASQPPRPDAPPGGIPLSDKLSPAPRSDPDG